MEKKFNDSKFSAFLKKNGYLILMIVCLAAIATLITYAVIRNQSNANNGLVNDNNDVTPIIADDKTNEDNKEKEDENTDPKPIVKTPVAISSPVADPVVLKGYSETELVYNATMKHWATHQAIDYKTEKGEAVKAVYDGEVTSVSTSTLKGTTVVIKHDDGLESSYSLLENVKVKAGDKVKKGDVIGYVGDTGIFETADGTHLHFELRKDGKLVDPELFSDSANK